MVLAYIVGSKDKPLLWVEIIKSFEPITGPAKNSYMCEEPVIYTDTKGAQYSASRKDIIKADIEKAEASLGRHFYRINKEYTQEV